MPAYIAFLRAINVGGRFAKMADLRTGLARAGLAAPFEGEVRRYVTFLKEDPDDDFVAAFDGWDIPGERAHVNGREVYLWLAHPSHTAKLSNARIERGGVVATTRDWKVVSALGKVWGG